VLIVSSTPNLLNRRLALFWESEIRGAGQGSSARQTTKQGLEEVIVGCRHENGPMRLPNTSTAAVSDRLRAPATPRICQVGLLSGFPFEDAFGSVQKVTSSTENPHLDGLHGLLAPLGN
jgi:hypothetical protein